LASQKLKFKLSGSLDPILIFAEFSKVNRTLLIISMVGENRILQWAPSRARAQAGPRFYAAPWRAQKWGLASDKNQKFANN
jgi:hypothetical protein